MLGPGKGLKTCSRPSADKNCRPMGQNLGWPRGLRLTQEGSLGAANNHLATKDCGEPRLKAGGEEVRWGGWGRGVGGLFRRGVRAGRNGCREPIRR